MSVDLVNSDSISQIVESVWTQVLGISSEPAGDDAASEGHLQWSVCVHITGAWNGAVLFWPGDRFASRAGAILFAIPESEVTQADIQDGIAELGNMIAGHLKSILPGPSALSLPTVTKGHRHEVFVRRTRLIAEQSFDFEGEPLRVLVLEGIPQQELSTARGADCIEASPGAMCQLSS